MARGVDTKALVFDLVRASGRASRAGLAERTGLTGATISTLVRQLMEEGLVEESGRARSTGGKPRTFVQVVPDARYAIGIHLTRCDMVLVLANLLGAVVARTRRPCDLGSHQWSQALTQAVDELVMGAGVPRERVLGAGVVGSDSVRAEILASQQARDISLLGRPVLFDNDASAAALGEWWVSPAGSTDDALVVYLGAGIGGGYLAGGRLRRGVNQGEGELGHVCVDMAGPVCSCGARGCLEAVGGPESVVRRAVGQEDLARAAGLGPQPGARGSVEANFAAVARVAQAGDLAAQRLLAESARALAVAVRSVVNVLDVATVVLTGPSAGAAGAFYLPVLEEELALRFGAGSRGLMEIRLSPSSGTAAALGAASLVLDTAVRATT
ncbi:ROK family protein [Actinomyces urogenitalis DSM 15434]|uniref:ROK family protein n=1 Tax=Actinomyces urogenitalis DSM 15434 TaxID=525246 RepID=C0W5K5_9ACTO|nr:ROK family transcriptional regulator [Actinomyces urogenitalis]EEH65986.1 ROK family protein [Actinomyces urogenitalis DSM 15434]MDU0864989.1 ROK family transcriptional regulator [Actinomyces urogenitalis]MDU0874132.1 ROK family transcriptional regulator [Actinomyces urogenitalis]MDU1563834.1 ROK family transcriptional regulator [Actinomyces urogenitalis]MDU1639201.1 ROK family transcriptional regulator [Actinomyces urogenitalis]